MALEISAAPIPYRKNGERSVDKRLRDAVPYHRCSLPIAPALPLCVYLDPGLQMRL